MSFDVATMLGGMVIGAAGGWYVRGLYGRARALWHKARAPIDGMMQ